MLGTLPFRFRQTALLHFQRARQMAEEGKGSKKFFVTFVVHVGMPYPYHALFTFFSFARSLLCWNVLPLLLLQEIDMFQRRCD
jgi:hypothetical protein